MLPVVPFALLMTAEWVLSGANALAKRYVWAGRTAVVFFAIWFLSFDVMQPLYYSGGGLRDFAAELQRDVVIDFVNNRFDAWNE